VSNAKNQAKNNQEENGATKSLDGRFSGEGVFIVGANGQLGTELQKQYPKAKSADIYELDITDKKSVESFDWSGIDILINAAAYTNVDGAETLEGRTIAWSVNADAVANLVAVSAQYDMTLVHISTDYVFDGTAEIHTEDEAFAPLSVYGASKAAGDIAVSLAPKFYILRTSWVIGEGNNFVRTMMSLAEKNISPTVVHDQIGRLTFTSELVRAIDHLLTPTHHSPFTIHPYGTYNVTNDGPSVSWADITRQIFNLLGRDDLTVTNATTEEYFKGKEGIAPRPLQSTLDLSKIKSTRFKSANWQEDLKNYVENNK
jgi:dTDP-4-dehydrorhamnose 3,5-epimerase